MQTQTAPNGAPVPAPESLRLDDLLRLDAQSLETLYRTARVPRIEDLQGDLKGRMLAWPALKGGLASVLRRFAGSDRFPWRGKSFWSLGPDRGEGDNRVLSDRRHWYRFTTFVGPSRAGAFDAVQLDYDHADNPFFIRAIKDEIRELRPGLYLGQAWLETGGRARLALYFGLERP